MRTVLLEIVVLGATGGSHVERIRRPGMVPPPVVLLDTADDVEVFVVNLLAELVIILVSGLEIRCINVLKIGNRKFTRLQQLEEATVTIIGKANISASFIMLSLILIDHVLS